MTRRPQQLQLPIGTEHVCRHEVRSLHQCKQTWRCEEEGCLFGRDAICPACSSPAARKLLHSAAYVNRAKREPEIGEKLHKNSGAA